MNFRQWFITLAAIAGDTLSILGHSSLGRLFTGIGKLAESGGDIEAHMALIAAKVQSGDIDSNDPAWAEAEEEIRKIQAEIDRS